MKRQLAWAILCATFLCIGCSYCISVDMIRPDNAKISARLSEAEALAWIRKEKAWLDTKHGANSVVARSIKGTPMRNFDHDRLWAVEVEIGTPPQRIAVAVDTGSSDLWVSDAFFHAKNSSTFCNVYSDVRIRYGSGTVDGKSAIDSVSIAGLTSKTQTFVTETRVNGLDLGSRVGGVLGMGTYALASTKANPLWKSIGLKNPSFGLFLQREAAGDATEAPGGVLTLGAPNRTLHKGDVNYVDAYEDKSWSVPLGGVNVSGHQVLLDGNSVALIDSGTTLVGGPPLAVHKIYAHIPGATQLSGTDGYYKYPCSVKPNVSFAFGNRGYLLNPIDFQVTIVTPGIEAVGDTEPHCIGALFAVQQVPHGFQWLIGAAFLKNVYTIFEETPHRIGFASLHSSVNQDTITFPVTPSAACTHSASLPMTLFVSMLCFVYIITW